MHFALGCCYLTENSILFANWQFAAQFSNYSNSLNFEAKINCNTIKPNVPKWRKTCTGLKFDLLHFYVSQSHLLSGGNLWGPCIYLSLCIHPINCCQVPNDLFPEGVQFGFYYNYCAEEDWHDSGARSTARVCCQVGAMAHRCG